MRVSAFFTSTWQHSVEVDHFPGHAAIDQEFLAGDETGVLGEQPGHQRRDILHRSDPADQVLVVVQLGQRRSLQPGLSALTRISGPRLAARAWVSASNPPLLAA